MTNLSLSRWRHRAPADGPALFLLPGCALCRHSPPAGWLWRRPWSVWWSSGPWGRAAVSDGDQDGGPPSHTAGSWPCHVTRSVWKQQGLGELHGQGHLSTLAWGKKLKLTFRGQLIYIWCDSSRRDKHDGRCPYYCEHFEIFKLFTKKYFAKNGKLDFGDLWRLNRWPEVKSDGNAAMGDSILFRTFFWICSSYRSDRDNGDFLKQCLSIAKKKLGNLAIFGPWRQGRRHGFSPVGQYSLFISSTACSSNFSGGNNIVLPSQPHLSGGKLPQCLTVVPPMPGDHYFGLSQKRLNWFRR